MKQPLAALALWALLLPANFAAADNPGIETATARQSSYGWTFDVTLSHPDTGWDHYADGWRVLDIEGNVLGQRVLAHPHVQEQPFTRSLGNVHVPQGSSQVQIQARCLRDGWAQKTYLLTLP